MSEEHLPIKQIDDLFKNADIPEYDALMERFRCDERDGVKKLLVKYQKKADALQAEYKRIDQMLVYERKYQEIDENGQQKFIICGLDEAGRGPLAGPVVAGAVVLPPDCSKFLYVNDSKQLSEKKREELYDVIMANALYAQVGIIPPKVIDEINILQATFEGMRQALSNLGCVPDILLNDALIIPGVEKALDCEGTKEIHQVKIIKGDAKSLSIAAASIIAKVTRDRIMREYDKVFPEYGFAGHKGYGCTVHIDAIRKYGPCPIHRATFIKNFVEDNAEE